MAYTQAQLTTFFTNANTGVAPTAAQSLALQAYATQSASGQLTDQQALDAAISLGANSTSAVGVQTYAFFTGVAPSTAGLSALNAAYGPNGVQANLNGENRFIAQSVALATQNAAAKTAFTTSYGSLSLVDATKAAYNIIIGAPAAAAAGVNVDAAVAYLTRAENVTYLNAFIRANTGLTAAADIDLAVKAAIIGQIMQAATTYNNGAGLGAYAQATDKLLADLADDGSLVANNAAGINLFSAYGAGGSTGGTPGSTQALTTAIDTLNGTANDDTFTGVIAANAAATADIKTTFSALDTVNGAAGVDTLNITYFDNTAAGAVALGNTTLPAASVTGVENVNVRSLSITAADVTTIAAGNFAGATQFVSDRSSNAVAVTGLTSGQAVGLNGVSGAAAVALTGTYGATATSAVINLSNGVIDNAAAATNTIALTGAALATATINSTGSANSVNTIAVGPGGTVSTLNLNAGVGLTLAGGFTGLGVATSGGTANINITGGGAVSLGGITAAGGNIGVLNINTSSGTANIGTIANAGFAANATINVSGAAATTAASTASVTLGTLGANVKTVNASGLTAGGVNATIGANAATIFTGGSGTDVITVGAGQGAALTGAIAGGAGTDIIAFSTGADLVASLTPLVTGFETLRVSNGGAVGTTQTYDPTLIAGITAYQVAASTGAVVLNNLTANPSITVTGNVAGTAGLALNLNNAGGANDQATLTLNNLATTGANVSGVSTTAVTLGGSVTAGQVETLNIVSAGRVTGTGTYNKVTLGASGAGPNYADANKVVITGGTSLELTTGISAHSIIIDASGATAPVSIINTAAVTGTVAITGTAAADSINSANQASIYGAAGGDAITLGAGVQTLVYKAAADSTLDLTGVAGASGVGGTVNVGKMDTVTGFVSGTDKIEVTAFAFNATQLGAVVDKGTVTDATLATSLASSSVFTDGINTRGLAQFHTAGGDTYLAIDANKDGVFTAANDLLVKLVGTATVAAVDIVG